MKKEKGGETTFTHTCSGRGLPLGEEIIIECVPEYMYRYAYE